MAKYANEIFVLGGKHSQIKPWYIIELKNIFNFNDQ
jgi:hypothetical protein